MQNICANVQVRLSSDPPSRRALLHLTQGIKALKLQSLLTAILGGIRGECAMHDIQSRHHLAGTVQRRATCTDLHRETNNFARITESYNTVEES